MSSSVPLFVVERVSVGFEGMTALDDVSLEVPDDGVTVVVGPSGSGKSTLLRLLNRLEIPTEGRVLFRGDEVAELDPLVLRRRVGMVFQRPTPFPGTVADNLRVGDPSLGPEALADLVVRVGLDGAVLERPAAELSGGECQRVCLARALAVGPDALLMDEPTSQLDPVNRRMVEALALDAVAVGVPVVWVTHDLDQAERLATRRYVLLDGRVADEAEARAFLASGGGEA